MPVPHEGPSRFISAAQEKQIRLEVWKWGTERDWVLAQMALSTVWGQGGCVRDSLLVWLETGTTLGH